MSISHLYIGRMIACLALGLACCRPVMSYTPDSPKVQAMVEKAAQYLESESPSRLGAACLMGLALYKAGRSPDHKLIREALEWCSRDIPNRSLSIGGEASYEISLANILMCEVSPDEHREEIERIVDATLEFQQDYGGWSYLGDPKGDTSQVQYCILSLWSARQIGVQVPDSAFIRCCNWLIRSQAPNGYWGYKANDSGVAGKRVAQKDKGHNATYHSTTAAALGTAYICADALGMEGLGDGGRSRVVGRIPAVFQLVGDDRALRVSSVNREFLKRAFEDGNAWFDEKFKINPDPAFPHYYRYAYERYRSFREKVAKQVQSDESWYDEGVDFLESVQTKWGSFEDGEAKRFGVVNASMTTSFAILFLTRGTQQSLGKLTQGSLKGQKGLPSNDSDIRMRNGRIITTPISRSVGDLLGMLESSEGTAALDDLINSELDLTLDGESHSRAQHAARLRTLVSDRSYRKRLLAVRTMGRMRDIENIPALIYSLSDPDWRVVLAANDALCHMARQFDSHKLPRDKADRGAAEQLARKWRKWYESLMP